MTNDTLTVLGLLAGLFGTLSFGILYLNELGTVDDCAIKLEMSKNNFVALNNIVEDRLQRISRLEEDLDRERGKFDKPADYYSECSIFKRHYLSVVDVRGYGIDFYKICDDFYPEYSRSKYGNETFRIAIKDEYKDSIYLQCGSFIYYSENDSMRKANVLTPYIIENGDTEFKIYDYDYSLIYECDSGVCEYGGLSANLAYTPEGCE